jgi:hypothetical protein
MVKVIENILSNDELNYWHNFCESIPDVELEKIEKNKTAYKRKIIVLSDTTKNKIFSILEKNYGLKCKMRTNWVNIITTESNKNDDYHVDISDVSLIIYLNDNFVGGEFEYLKSNGEIEIIKPIKNNGILLSKDIWHRVKPVLEGKRYSMVSFFYSDPEFVKEKTII